MEKYSLMAYPFPYVHLSIVFPKRSGRTFDNEIKFKQLGFVQFPNLH
jgi:hypothetical protein